MSVRIFELKKWVRRIQTVAGDVDRTRPYIRKQLCKIPGCPKKFVTHLGKNVDRSLRGHDFVSTYKFVLLLRSMQSRFLCWPVKLNKNITKVVKPGETIKTTLQIEVKKRQTISDSK